MVEGSEQRWTGLWWKVPRLLRVHKWGAEWSRFGVLVCDRQAGQSSCGPDHDQTGYQATSLLVFGALQAVFGGLIVSPVQLNRPLGGSFTPVGILLQQTYKMPMVQTYPVPRNLAESGGEKLLQPPKRTRPNRDRLDSRLRIGLSLRFKSFHSELQKF
ncbi:hypothetical protein Bbelb_086500 [Branchiostoma belcheri]|nr:hypothetical protein Bbelb_086500 [Branchiostoma belcheri]